MQVSQGAIPAAGVPPASAHLSQPQPPEICLATRPVSDSVLLNSGHMLHYCL